MRNHVSYQCFSIYNPQDIVAETKFASRESKNVSQQVQKHEYILGAHTVFPRFPRFPMHLFPSMKRRFMQLALRSDTDYKIAI